MTAYKENLLNSALIKPECLFDNENFPELEDLEVLRSLGGTTGAMLVKDKKTGKEYVKKTGNSKEHVEEEFLANSIYKLMEVNVPNMKLYRGKYESVLLSDYMPDTTNIHKIINDDTRDRIAENFVLDCLLANWDLYNNGNILNNNKTGDLVRVDNGGALRFSAPGRPKGRQFGDYVNELESMVSYNPYFAKNLKDTDLKKQIKKILVKEDNILSLIEDEKLRKTIKNRIMDLKSRLSAEPKDKGRVLKNVLNTNDYKEIIDNELFGPGITPGNRFKKFIEISGNYEGENYWYALKQAYINSNGLFPFRRQIKNSFIAKHSNRESLMSLSDLKALKALPESFMIYRGTTMREKQTGDIGVSWTLSKKTAELFAVSCERNYTDAFSPSVVLQMPVLKKDVIAYFNDRMLRQVIFISPQEQRKIQDVPFFDYH